MGLISFVKSAGEKLFGASEAKAATADDLHKELQKHGLDTSGVKIAVDGDKAQSRTYVDALIMVGDTNSGVNAAGFYDDDLIRGDDGWQVARRRFIQVRVAPVGDPA